MRLLCRSQVGANAGVIGMAKEHLGLALALNVPVFVVVTKIDMCPANVLQDTLKVRGSRRLFVFDQCKSLPFGPKHRARFVSFSACLSCSKSGFV